MRIALAAALLAAMTSDAAAHCYSVWHYPFPQKCQTHAAHGHIFARASRQKAAIQLPTKPEPTIALPSLTRGEIDFGKADEPTRGRVLLRAALEAANGH